MTNLLFRIDPATLDFQLPDELIAQEPSKRRESARLLVVDRTTGKISHRVFSDLTDYLNAGDVLVINRAKVNKSKVMAQKKTGGKVEIVFLASTEVEKTWTALVRPLLKEGTEIVFKSGARAVQAGRETNGENRLRFELGSAEDVIASEGQIPLPPYIKRAESDPRKKDDDIYYQTVYASEPGSVAAPTAGLHFSSDLLAQLERKGVEIVPVLLNVGWGTFRPIAGNVESHTMLGETFDVSSGSFQKLRAAKKEGRRIITVGTTSTRVLESLSFDADAHQLRGETKLFIRPGFEFKWIQGLITNLHVPKSTPVSLTAAFAGHSHLEDAYGQAIAERYRFFSYGDAMLIL
jgi:S-adenosylmethionine:tRNA ribosyltransferase-isomerase